MLAEHGELDAEVTHKVQCRPDGRTGIECLGCCVTENEDAQDSGKTNTDVRAVADRGGLGALGPAIVCPLQGCDPTFLSWMCDPAGSVAKHFGNDILKIGTVSIPYSITG